MKKVTIFIITVILWPIIKRLARATYFLGVLALIYLSRYLASFFTFLSLSSYKYAQIKGIIRSDADGDIEKLRDYLKDAEFITVSDIRGLGFSANKSVAIRKNLEKFGIIRSNPQHDNRGEVIANESGIDQTLYKLGESIYSPTAIMIN